MPESPAEIRQALERILLEPDPRPALVRLQREGTLATWLPEVEATVALLEPGDSRHKDLWQHTLQVVAQSPARPVVRWAALLHDIGKVATRAFGPAGEVTFFGHPEQGALLVEVQIAPRLGFPDATRDGVARLVRHHQRAAQYDDTWSDGAVRRFGRDLGDAVADLLDLGRADVTTGFADRRQRALARIDALQARLAALRAEEDRRPALPSGLGTALMARFHLAPGPEVGRLMRRLEAAVEQGRLPAGAAPDVYLRWLEERAST